MGPFLAAGSGETTEWCDSGVEGWKKQEGGGKGQGSRGERRRRGKEEKKGIRRERGGVADDRF